MKTFSLRGLSGSRFPFSATASIFTRRSGFTSSTFLVLFGRGVGGVLGRSWGRKASEEGENDASVSCSIGPADYSPCRGRDSAGRRIRHGGRGPGHAATRGCRHPGGQGQGSGNVHRGRRGIQGQGPLSLLRRPGRKVHCPSHIGWPELEGSER